MANPLQTGLVFVKGARAELQKVTWPDWPQLKNSTWVIVVFVAVLTLLVFAMDFVSSRLLALISSIFGG